MTDPLDIHADNDPASDGPPNTDGEVSDVTSLEDRLTAHFHGEAELIPVAESLGRPTSLDAVRVRAEKRRSRRQAGVGAVAAACIAVIGFGALQLGSNDQENDVAAVETTTTLAPADSTSDETDSSSSAETDPVADLLASDGPRLQWQEATDLPQGINGFSIAVTPDAFYAPAPDDDRTTTVYRSTDGLVWEEVATDLPIAGFRLQASGDVLLLEGNAEFVNGTDVDGPPTFEYLISRDKGQTWSEVELPEAATIGTESNGIVFEQSNSVSIASLGDTLVVAQTTFLFADLNQILAQDGIEAYGYEVTTGAVRVFAEDDQFSAEGTLIPFDEISAFDNIDLSVEELTNLLQSDTSSVEIFRSVNDGPFEPIDLELPSSIDFASVTSSNGVAVLQVFGSSSTHYRSTDGLTWTDVDSDSNVEVFGTPGNSGQSLLGFGPDGLLESVDGGETWSQAEVSPLIQPMELVRSNLGVTVVASGTINPGVLETPIIEITKDNLTFTMSFEEEGEGDMVLTDNVTGEELRRITPDEMDPDGENGPGLTFDEATQTIEISSLETDEVLMTFTVEELTVANPEMMVQDVDDFSFVIGHSIDGEEYGWISVSDLTDSAEAFPTIAATNDVVMVFFDGPVGSEVFVASEVVE